MLGKLGLKRKKIKNESLSHPFNSWSLNLSFLYFWKSIPCLIEKLNTTLKQKLLQKLKEIIFKEIQDWWTFLASSG
jgi:hypothetical protein